MESGRGSGGLTEASSQTAASFHPPSEAASQRCVSAALIGKLELFREMHAGKLKINGVNGTVIVKRFGPPGKVLYKYTPFTI